MKKIYVIGCGGVGSWLAPALCLLVKPENVVLVDGDRLEKKNMNRQLFNESDIGKFKAVALGDRYGCDYRGEWYSRGGISHTADDWLFCCADNNPARVAVLEACDEYNCQAIIAANETTSSEAYYYRRRWRDTGVDPRVYYPELLTVHAGDPRGAAIGCTGEAAEQTPQLVTANATAAALAGHLYVLWGLNGRKISREMLPNMPYLLRANLSKIETCRIEQRLNQRT